MSSQLDVRIGVQVPQIQHLPPNVHSLAAAEEAIELADAYGVCSGFPLSESQRFTLRAALGERRDGSWAAATVADFKPRQGGGKTDTITARELAGLILFDEQLIIHTAHEFSTANEAFLRLVAVFENWDDLRSKVARIRYANGEQGIELLSGQRLKYRARTGGAGRGFSKADLVVYDEAQHLQAEHVAASGPARLASKNPQSWYAGSGGLMSSKQAWVLRRRALTGDGGRFAYVENTAEDVRLIDGVVVSSAPDSNDREAWARAMPGLGWWVTEEAMADLYGEMGPDLFARECLCVWEQEVDASGRVIPADAWVAVRDGSVELGRQVVFGFDVVPDRSRAAIAVSDGGAVELVDARPGVGWLVDRLVELSSAHHATVAADPSAPAGAFLRELVDRKVKIVEVSGREFVQACGSFYDRVMERKIKVRPVRTELDAAIAGAVRRNVGDAWAWGRRGIETDISPLVAVTIAAWVAGQRKRAPLAAW